MKNLFWRVGRLWCAGIVLLLLRLTQNRSGFDPATGLSVPSLPGMIALVILALCAAGEFALSFRNSKEKTAFCAQFAPPEQELLAAVLGSLLLAAGGILLALQGFRGGDIARGRRACWQWLPGPACWCSTARPGPAASCLWRR